MLILIASLLGGPGQPGLAFQELPAAPAAVARCQAEGEIKWFQGSYESLLKQAEKDKQLIFLDFWTDW